MIGIDSTHSRRIAAGLWALAVVAIAAFAQPAAAWELRVCADPDKLPFSRADGAGFENKIAELVAKELRADLTFLWMPQTVDMINQQLRVGECDLIAGVEDGQAALTSTLAYYRSPMVFLQRADHLPRIEMFDDPALQGMRIGIQPSGGVAHDALEVRGLGANLKFYDFLMAPIIEDVAKGTDIDIGVLWGPTAGYFGAQQDVPMVVSPVTPEFEPPFTPMYINIVMGVRRGDEALRDLLDFAISQQWEAINAVLAEFHIPVMPLSRPMLTLGAQ